MKNNKLLLKIILYPYFSFFLLTKTLGLFEVFSLSEYYTIISIVSLAKYFVIGCLMGDLVETLIPLNKQKLVFIAVACVIPLVPILSFVLRIGIFPASFYAKYLTLFLLLFGFYLIIFIKTFSFLKKE